MVSSNVKIDLHHGHSLETANDISSHTKIIKSKAYQFAERCFSHDTIHSLSTLNIGQLFSDFHHDYTNKHYNTDTDDPDSDDKIPHSDNDLENINNLQYSGSVAFGTPS